MSGFETNIIALPVGDENTSFLNHDFVKHEAFTSKSMIIFSGG
jgi:hypothetical protein